MRTSRGRSRGGEGVIINMLEKYNKKAHEAPYTHPPSPLASKIPPPPPQIRPCPIDNFDEIYL